MPSHGVGTHHALWPGRHLQLGCHCSWTSLRAAHQAPRGKALAKCTLYHCKALTQGLPVPAAARGLGRPGRHAS